MKYCTFAGHREVFVSEIADKIDSEIEKILMKDNAFAFFCGGMGEFDSMCAGAVRSAKRMNRDKNIRLILVCPYMSDSLNKYKEYYETDYDDIIIPEEILESHYKSAITKRNRWMIDNSDYLIAYVRKDYGGAYNTLKYAQKKEGLTVINLYESQS